MKKKKTRDKVRDISGKKWSAREEEERRKEKEKKDHDDVGISCVSKEGGEGDGDAPKIRSSPAPPLIPSFATRPQKSSSVATEAAENSPEKDF